jgi:ParB family chromosome partitioning protein
MRNIRVKQISKNFEKMAAPNSFTELRPSIGMENRVGEYLYIEVERLSPYKKQARKIFDEEELKALAQTIKEYGVRQPLSVIKEDEIGKYQVISGERRLRAARMAGLERVPCIIIDNPNNAEEIAIIENIQRSDLHPIELSAAYSSLLKNYNYGDQSKLAIKLGLSPSQISETIKLSELPRKIQDYLINNNIRNRSIFRNLLACSSEHEMDYVLGMEKNKPNAKIKKIKLLNIYVKDGEFISEVSMGKISSDQKVVLKKKLEELLEMLKF